MNWLDAQHLYWAIEQRVVKLTALHAVAATEDTVAVGTPRIRPRPTPRRLAAWAAGAVAAVPAAAQGRGGREPVRRCRTRLRR